MKFQIFIPIFLSLLSLSCSLPGASNVVNLKSSDLNLKSMSLLKYSSTLAFVNIIGTLPSGTTSLNTVQFFNTADCSGPSIGQGVGSDFSGTGIQIQVPISSTLNTTTQIYLSTNTLSKCFLLGGFTFNPVKPDPPAFTYTVPGSPSRASYNPAVFGTALDFSTVNLYSDSACSTLVGSDSAQNFSSLGVSTNLTPNGSTDVYGQVRDAVGQLSTCTKLTTYTNANSGPTAPVYASIAPASPNNVSTTPLLKGTPSADSISVTVFSDAGCSHSIGADTADNFKTLGVQLSVAPNVLMSLYVETFDISGNPSNCTFLTNYLYDSVAPVVPSFLTATPSSPTRLSTNPIFTGLSSSDTVTVKFYNSMLCLVQIGSGTKAAFEGSGISVAVQGNATTTIYAQALDAAGNRSSCVHMIDYLNNTIPPDSPLFGTTIPLSPNNKSATPIIQGTTGDGTISLQFFSDQDCTAVIGSGTTAQFEGAGIQLTTPSVPNSVNTTSVYVQAMDIEGNASACSSLTTYSYSTSKAPSPTFIQTVPNSPSRTVSQPYVLGQAPPTVKFISLYSDASCNNLLGTATRGVFATQGIHVTIPDNTATDIYAQSADVYANTSDCILLTTYVYDTIAPIAPSFIASNPISPNNTSTSPLISGSVILNEIGKPLTTSIVNLYDSFICLNQIGSGTPADFTSTGVAIAVPNNVVTSVYAQTQDAAGNISSCAFMLDYTTDTNRPGVPIFTSATPMTPSYTQKTNLIGSIGTHHDILNLAQLNFYSDSTCLTQFGSGAVAQYTTTGIPVTMGANTTTNVYALVTDIVGNQSDCTYLLDYFHNDIGPSGLQSVQNVDGSISLSWLADITASPTPKYLIKRSLYSGGPYTILAWQNSGSNYTDYSVTNGQTYYYVISATNNTGTSNDSSEISVTVVSSSPQAAINLVATPGQNIVELSWQGFSPDMFFKVLRATQSGGPYTIVKSDIVGTLYDDTTVVDGVSYFYVVVGINPQGISQQSNEVSTQALDAPPAGPTNLTAVLGNNLAACGGGSGVTLSWSSPSYFTSFQIQRGNLGSEMDLVTVGATQYVDCNPYTGNNYIFAYDVEALWGPSISQVRSPPSNEVSVSFQSGPGISVYPGHNQVYVTWNAQYQAVDYQIWRATESGFPSASYVQLNANYSSTNYLDSTAVDGTAYYYVVITNYAGGVPGLPSTEVSGIPGPNPSAPSNLVVAYSKASNLPVLNWSAPSNFDYFNVYRATSVGGPYGFVAKTFTPTYIETPPGAGRYYYYVTLMWGGFETAPTNTVSYRTGYPLTFSATQTLTSIGLTWSAVAGASSYNILRGTTSGGPYTQISSGTTLSFSNTTSDATNPITAGVGYYYVVQAAFADTTKGEYSAEVGSMTTSSNVPTGVTVTSKTTSSVSLAWVRVKNATAYKVYTATSFAGPYTLFGTSFTNSQMVTPLLGSTNYYFTVSAQVGGVYSPQSTPVLGITNSPPLVPALYAGNAQVKVTWSFVTGASTYSVLRSTDSVNFTTIQAGLVGISFNDLTAVNGQLYFYEISAIFPGETLTSASSVGVTPGVTPLAPSGITMTANTDGTDVTFNWAQVSGADSYNIYLATTSGGPWGAPYQKTSSSTGNTISGLTPGIVYYMSVSSLNGLLESTLAPQMSFVPAVTPPAPQLLVVSPNVSVSWSAVSGASKYDIFRSVDGVNFSILISNLATTNYTDTSVVAAQAYYYEYLPKTAAGIPMAISSVAGSIIPGVGPSSPTDLFISSNTMASVTLNWVPVSQASNYNIYRGSASGGPYTLLTSISAVSSQYMDSTVMIGNNYSYVVSAVNTYGVESLKSNQVFIQITAGPAALTASNVSSKVSLAWTAVAGVSGYTIYRANQSGGPYGSIANVGAGVTGYQDAQVISSIAYYYVVNATLGNGAQTLYSNEASVNIVKSFNLQVPIELTDQAISSDTMAITFDSTRTSLDTNAYDGAVTYSMDVVGVNMDSSPQTVNIVDSNNTVKGTATILANTNIATRISGTFSPNGSRDNYRIRLSATSTSSQLQVFSARMYVNQVGATKTKLYFPLLSSANVPTSGDVGSPVEAVSNNNYQILNSSSTYTRDVSHLSQLLEYNAWEFEALVSSNGSTGIIGLYNITRGAIVPDTESEFTTSGISLLSSPFDDGVQNFSSPTNDLDQYRVVMECYGTCANGAVNAYKAGVWVSLSNLNSVEVTYRNTLANYAINTPTYLDFSREKINLSLFSNPVINFRATVLAPPSGGSASVQIFTDGANDSGESSVSVIAGSTLNFTDLNFVSLQTSSPLILNSNDRIITFISPTGGTAMIQDSAIVIDASP